MCLSPDGSALYVTDTIGDRVAVIRIDSGETVYVPVGDRPEAVAASPDGRFLYCVNFFSQTLSVIDTHAFSVVGELPLGNGPSGVAVSPDGRYVYVTNRFDNNVSIVDSDTLDVLEKIEVGKAPTRITVHVASDESASG
jgi:YVTN family beta-propeller protein